MWTNNPVALQSGDTAHYVLKVDYEIAVLNAAVMVPLNLLALFWIIKRKEWGPIFFIVISIGNRIASQFIFDSGIHLIFLDITAILVFFAYLVYKQLNKIEILSLVGGVISGNLAFYLAYNYTYNSVIATTAFVLVLASWIGAMKAIVKSH